MGFPPTRRPQGLALLATLTLLATGVALTPRSARAGGAARLAGIVPFGVGDENPTLFEDPRLRWLGVRYARLIVPWDVMRDPRQLERASRWLANARIAGVEPLVSFNQSASHPKTLPGVAGYAKAVRAFMRAFPWVSHYQPWNEENEAGEPTSRSPARAAAFFNWLARACSSCTVTAADLLDGPSMYGWLRRFLTHARHPRIWGFHPYLELAYGGHDQLSALTRLVQGQIWLTEAGLPVWRFVRVAGQFRYIDAQGQIRAARRLLALLRLTGRVARVYYYQWRASTPLSASRARYSHHRHVIVTWDSGLLNPDCSPRPAFAIIARALGRRAGAVPKVRRADHSMACLPSR
jgi:hypothetical protein